MKFFLLLLLIILSTPVSAVSLCERVKEGIPAYLLDPSSRLGFENAGGLFKGGVCWWHNRLQRSSAYLAEFYPERPRPSASQLRSILAHLKLMDRTVVIPGFADFHSFSMAYKKELQRLLNAWQLEDGFFNFEWIRGISGRSGLDPDEMKERMDILYGQFLKSPHPVWVMAQTRGFFASHSFLILSMETQGGGYELKLVDSNLPTPTVTLQYQVGQPFLVHPYHQYSFIPYLGFQKDFKRILSSVAKACHHVLGPLEDIPLGEVELKGKEGP